MRTTFHFILVFISFKFVAYCYEFINYSTTLNLSIKLSLLIHLYPIKETDIINTDIKIKDNSTDIK